MQTTERHWRAVQVGPATWHGEYRDWRGRWLVVCNTARRPIAYASYGAALDQGRWKRTMHAFASDVRKDRNPQLELPL